MPVPPERYPVPGAPTRVEDEVKGSRFVTTIAPAATVAQARAFIQSIREEFSDATHNCWAHVIGSPGSTRDTGAGDDGEPGGTAGQPMLRVLLGSDVGDVAVVVTRYFGGVKLGRGGLVRAYSSGVQHALREMPRSERRVLAAVRIGIPYAFVDPIKRILSGFEGKVDSETFAVDAEITANVPAEHVTDLETAVRDATSGAARFYLLAKEDDSG